MQIANKDPPVRIEIAHRRLNINAHEEQLQHHAKKREIHT